MIRYATQSQETTAEDSEWAGAADALFNRTSERRVVEAERGGSVDSPREVEQRRKHALQQLMHMFPDADPDDLASRLKGAVYGTAGGPRRRQTGASVAPVSRDSSSAVAHTASPASTNSARATAQHRQREDELNSLLAQPSRCVMNVLDHDDDMTEAPELTGDILDGWADDDTVLPPSEIPTLRDDGVGGGTLGSSGGRRSSDGVSDGGGSARGGRGGGGGGGGGSLGGSVRSGARSIPEMVEQENLELRRQLMEKTRRLDMLQLSVAEKERGSTIGGSRPRVGTPDDLVRTWSEEVAGADLEGGVSSREAALAAARREVDAALVREKQVAAEAERARRAKQERLRLLILEQEREEEQNRAREVERRRAEAHARALQDAERAREAERRRMRRREEEEAEETQALAVKEEKKRALLLERRRAEARALTLAADADANSFECQVCEADVTGVQFCTSCGARVGRDAASASIAAASARAPSPAGGNSSGARAPPPRLPGEQGPMIGGAVYDGDGDDDDCSEYGLMESIYGAESAIGYEDV